MYFNDQISGRLWKEFTLNFGLRFERYNTSTLNQSGFFKSRNGAFLNPRINFAYYLSENTQFRIGIGAASKSPSLNHIYPDIFYLDVQDILPVNDAAFILDSLITTYKFDQSNPNLKGFQEKKIEMSFDFRFGYFGSSLTGFYSERNGEPISKINPFLYYKYLRPNWQQQNGGEIADTLMSYYTTTINAGWSKFNGMEFTLKSQRINKLNMDFMVNAAYHHVKEKITGLNGKTIFPNNYTIPLYKNFGRWTEKLLLTYQVNYVSKALGIWVTLTAQHVPHYQYKILGGSDSLAVAYYDVLNRETVYIDEADRLNERYKAYRLLKNPLQNTTRNYANKWLFNISMSKALFNGAEVSFFINNFWNDRAIQECPAHPGYFISRNPEIFYGIEFSLVMDKILQ